jgi:hypothetical protein
MNFKFFLPLFIFLIPLHIKAQEVGVKRTYKASFSLNGIDTLKYPLAGGLSNPQFSNIDLDGDNVQDLFVFDRSGGKVLCFLRKQNQWVYAPEYEWQFPPLFEWAFIKDYNCDGKPDILTETDYTKLKDPNSNVETSGLRVLKNISTTPGKLKWSQYNETIYTIEQDGLPRERLSIPLRDLSSFEDLDGDGDLDLVTMPDGKNVMKYYQNQSKELGFGCDSILFKFRDECWGFVSYLVNSHGFLLHDNSPCFRTDAKSKKHNGSTITLLDYDNDKDMDVLYGDMSFNEVLLLRNGKTLNSQGLDSIIQQDTVFPSTGTQASLSIFPATFIVDINDDGKKDLIVTPNAVNAAKNADMVMSFINNSSTAFNFSFQQSDFLINQMLDLGGGSKPCLVDLDNDEDLDLVIATHGNFLYTQNSHDRLVYFENIGSKTNPKFLLKDTNFLQINQGSEQLYEMAPSFGDLNQDGKLDLLIGDMNGAIHYYQNNSVGSNLVFEKLSANYFDIHAGTFAHPQLIDLNKDGKLDLIIGRRNGTIAYFENTGTPQNPIFGSQPTLDSVGKVNVSNIAVTPGWPDYIFPGYATPHVCDLDNDGKFEVLVGSIFGELRLFRNFDLTPNRISEELIFQFKENDGDANRKIICGASSAPFVADIDSDGKPEILVGSSKGGLEMFEPYVKGVISGVNELSNKIHRLEVIPNPNKGAFRIASKDQILFANYKIFTSEGKLVSNGIFEQNQEIIFQSEPGFYILVMEDGKGGMGMAKFVVN